jgi:hypothetical protein
MTSEVTQAARKAACQHYGYDDEKDLTYWGNVSNHRDVERLAKSFAKFERETIARLTAQSGEGRSGAGENGPTTAIIAGLWLDILEKDDRTSPEEYPDMALITEEEFAGSIRYARAALNARQSGEGERAIIDLLDDIEDEWIDYYLRPDSAQRAKCKVCGEDEFFKTSIEHKPGCIVGRIRAALRATDDAGGA